MKIQFRRGAFETNSSSMHSIVITKNSDVFTQKEIREEFYFDMPWYRGDTKKLELHKYDFDYFGREFDILATFRDKLKYAIASYCGDNCLLKDYEKSEQYFNDVFVPLLCELVGVTKVEMPTETRYFDLYADTVTEDENQDIRTYEEVPYEDLVYLENSEDGECYAKVCKSGRERERWGFDVINVGGIDHQSCGVLQGFLKKYNISLKDFLIRKNIVVIIDGDETCIFQTMKEAGLIDKDNIKEQYG